MSEETSPSLGRNMRRLRKQRGWSMVKMADHVGMTQSSLSKVENDQMSLSYDKLVFIARRLEVEIQELFLEENHASQRLAASARLSVNRAEEHEFSIWKNFRHCQLANNVKDRLMITTYAELVGEEKYLDPELELGAYYGERFIYVLEGTLNFHSEFYETYTLNAGDSIYFDIRMRHNFSVPLGQTARCLAITASDDKKFMEMERALAAHGLTNIAEWELLQRPTKMRKPSKRKQNQ